MLNLVLFGGGRWARVIAGVLGDILPGHHEIFWVSGHEYEALAGWVKEQGKSRMTVLKDDAGLWGKNLQAAIVATAPGTHASYAEKSISRGIPTLIEKPFAMNAGEAQHLLALAQKTKCPAGVNLVFMYADYLQDFAARIAQAPLKNVEITWHDPALEARYGAEKRPDFYTSMAHDMLPHAWSILHVLRPGLDIGYDDVVYDEKAVVIHGRAQSTAIKISLSRRVPERVRRVKINDGEWVLDFAQEPGFVLHEGERTENQWRGKTPLVQSLTEFLQVAQGASKAAQWRVSAEGCVGCVNSSGEAAALLEEAQYKRLAELAVNKDDLLNNHANLLIDLFLPQVAARGERPSVKTAQEQKDFAARALSLYDRKNSP